MKQVSHLILYIRISSVKFIRGIPHFIDWQLTLRFDLLSQENERYHNPPAARMFLTSYPNQEGTGHQGVRCNKCRKASPTNRFQSLILTD